METKRLSAKGVFEVRRKLTRVKFFEKCEDLVDENENPLIKFDSGKRFWEAKEKINVKVYEACCDLLNINPQEHEDRTPWQLNISAIELQGKLNFSKAICVKATTYNEITISELEIYLEPNQVVISGKWQGIFRDDYHEVLKEFKLVEMFMAVAGIEIVDLENKKLFQVSSGGNFSLKYLLSCQDFKIQIEPNNVTIGFELQSHQAFCQFFTKYNERITVPIMEFGIISEEILQKIVEEEVGHKFFKITEFSINENSLNLIIDQSYTSNKGLVDSHLK